MLNYNIGQRTNEIKRESEELYEVNGNRARAVRLENC
jgi:hypothetical protein